LTKTNRFPTDIGYFSNNNITEYLGLKSYSPKVREILEKFVENGMLESKPYKRGLQYKYIHPTSEKVSNGSSGQLVEYKDPVPGINNKSFKARNKDITEIIRSVEKMGCRVERMGSDHTRVYNKTGQFITFGTTGNRDYEPHIIKSKLSKIGIVV
jgi:hypothetical protein